MPADVISLCRQIGHGDRSRFSFWLEFLANPEPGGVPAEEDASWGRFQIWAGGRNLCAHYVDGVLYESVTWYLLPMLEWLAKEWDYLLHEQRLPFRNAGGYGGEALRILNSPGTFEQPGGWDSAAASCVEEWARRHSLLLHREGGLYPDIWFRRAGERVEVSWTDDSPAGAPDGFRFSNGSGGTTLDPSDVVVSLFAVLAEATRTLSAALGNTKRIRDLTRTVRDLRAPAHRMARVGILAGLGQTPADWPGRWDGLVRELQAKHRRQADWIRDLFVPHATEDLFVGGECAGALMFSCVSPAIDAGDALKLAELMLEQAASRKGQDLLLAQARHDPIVANLEPWRQGYSLAREWSEIAGLSAESEPVDIEALLGRQGVGIKDIRLADTSIGAVAIAHRNRRPVIAVNLSNPRNQYPTGRRFTLAHELCHLLYDRSRGVELQIASGPWAPVEVEKRANAFAAGLLMPDALVSRVCGELGIDVQSMNCEQLLALAKRLGVSPAALLPHLGNRGWISEEHRDQLSCRSENEPASSPAPVPPIRRRGSPS